MWAVFLDPVPLRHRRSPCPTRSLPFSPCRLVFIAGSFAQAQPSASPSAAAGPYHVVQTFHIGGAGGWDYLTVDPQHKLLYVPRSTHTMVVDAATGKTVADIPGQKRNHGVAIVPSVGRGFISDGQDASVTVFDLKTNKVLGKVKAADDADGIIYDPNCGKSPGVLRRCQRDGRDLARRRSRNRQGRRGGRPGRQARVPRRGPRQNLCQPRGQGPGGGDRRQDDEGRPQAGRPPPAARRSAWRSIRSIAACSSVAANRRS